MKYYFDFRISLNLKSGWEEDDRLKIRIVTFQRADNYGAVLQCYALYSFIRKLNLDTKVLDYRNQHMEAQYNIVPGKGRIEKVIIYIIKYLHPSYRWQFLRKRRFESFRRRIAFTEPMSEQELKKTGIKCNLLISGSDQVLNPDITKGIDDIYFLDFPCDGIRALYAASIGGLNSEHIRNKLFLEKINNIDFLSMREQDACDYIKEILGKKVERCADPTLLLEKNEWDKIIKDIHYRGVPEKYILLYYLEKNPNLIEAAERIAQIRKIPILYFDKKAKPNYASKFCGDAGPLEFIWLIKHASMIITSSFHASVFSFIYEKEICIMKHSKTGSRVTSLAELFNAKEVICSSAIEAISRSNIDYRYDQKVLRLLRDESMKYIKHLIEKAEEKNGS